MKEKLSNLLKQRKKGLALISVLAMISLATILILALFSTSESEFKAAGVYASGNSAKHLADSSVNLVIGQIQAATFNSTQPTGVRNIWASQPGAVRVYNTDGTFLRGHKLYSDAKMVVEAAGVAGETEMATDAPDGDWDIRPDQYVDLNEPVVRAGVAGTTNRTFFPIIDPRASAEDTSTPMVDKVEGFSYSSREPSSLGGRTINGVVGGTVAADNLRLPMPVEWIYLLRDGSMGTVNESGNWVSGAGAGSPNSENNPIVGRIGFWADDETSKVNINTASEPGYWGVPTFFHERDRGWADSPPTLHEYQRFPGHPATVSLSSVLYPSNIPGFLDSYGKTGTLLSNILDIKEKIYQIVPKINGGGSRDGTLAFAADDTLSRSSGATSVDIRLAKAERLYANIDELIFSPTLTSNKRAENNFTLASGQLLMDATVLDRKRFFLTANSRSPETTMFGTPRVAIWPVPDQTLGAQYRTGYDVAIATCATLTRSGSNHYYFSRKNADSALEDIGRDAGGAAGLLRNLNLMDYLDYLVQKPMPGGASFTTKYGNDARQVLVEIFDYIRTTNLYDSFLAPKFVITPGGTPTKTNETSQGGMLFRWNPDPNNPNPLNPTGLEEKSIFNTIPPKTQYYTYTEPRFKVEKGVFDAPSGMTTAADNEVVATGVYPGHGQVDPIEWEKDNVTYRGLGRFPTISEVGLHFICTADGKNDEGSYRIPVQSGRTWVTPPFGDGTGAGISGGRTAEMINPSLENQRVSQQQRDPFTGQNTRLLWYSNYPPFPSDETLRTFGVDPNSTNTRSPTHKVNHPAAKGENWNATLDRDTPLRNDEKRIQVALQIECFVPQVGWTKYTPEFTIVMRKEGLQGIKVMTAAGTKEAVFNTTQDQVLKSNLQYVGSASGLGQGTAGTYPMGATASIRALTNGRRIKSVGTMGADPNFDSDATSAEHDKIYNYPLVSSFFTVKAAVGDLLDFDVESPLLIDIYTGHDWEAKGKPSQTVELAFPTNTRAPIPDLVVYSTEKRKWEDAQGRIYTQRAVDAVRWWCFNWGGALHRWSGTLPNVEEFPKGNLANVESAYDVRTRGRFEAQAHNSIDNIPTGSLIYGYTPVDGYRGVPPPPPDPAQRRAYTPSGNVTAMSSYLHFGSDTVRSLIPKHGDYRLVAGRSRVPKEMFVPHPLWNLTTPFFAHNFSSFFSNTEVGFHRGGSSDLTKSILQRLVSFAGAIDYRDNLIPDMPNSNFAAASSRRYGDFDSGPGNCRDGAYVNKPDEGNLSVIRTWLNNDKRMLRNNYFYKSFVQQPTNEAYFTPNRMIPSPGMFGSLPTGVFGGGSTMVNKAIGAAYTVTDRANIGDPWRTLLFRASGSQAGNANVRVHPGAPAWVKQGGDTGVSPADHYMMDLFWMPIVEPYALSEGYSTAGKVNLNYQIVPFTYINRLTGLYAALKGELIPTVPNSEARINVVQSDGVTRESSYKEFKDLTQWPPKYWNESSDGKYWYRYMDIKKTVLQIKARLEMDTANADVLSQGLMRTASQICEIHLVPKNVGIAAIDPNIPDIPDTDETTRLKDTDVRQQMTAFWATKAGLTGDNLRERPYTNLYQKITTRSNTFRVHFRAQSLKKARSLAATKVDTTKDTVTAEYRGSALIERFLDLNDPRVVLPDYADGSDPFSKRSLEAFYRFRTLEMKQFVP